MHRTLYWKLFIRTLYAQRPVSLRIFPSFPSSRPRFFVSMQIQYSYKHTLSRLYVQNPVLEIVPSGKREGLSTHVKSECSAESPLCVASCAPKDSPISPRFSPKIFHRDANSVHQYSTTVHSFRHTRAQIDAPLD